VQVRLLENTCIPADGGQAYINMKSRTCVGGFFGDGPSAFFVHMLSLLGVGVEQMQHYPYVRQWEGPAVHLDRVTFDCSPAVYRNFWHVLKLREAFHRRLRPSTLGDHEAEPPPSRILILNRNLCERPATNGAANGTRVAPVAKCHSGRSVRHHKAIFRAIASNFSQWRVTDFTGTEPYREQARSFYDAALVLGPHGAQHANMVYSREEATIIEYLGIDAARARTSNSALYAGYASIFGLAYWVLISDSPNGSYDSITAEKVVHVVRQALDPASYAADSGVEVLAGDEESLLVRGYGSYHAGWPTGW